MQHPGVMSEMPLMFISGYLCARRRREGVYLDFCYRCSVGVRASTNVLPACAFMSRTLCVFACVCAWPVAVWCRPIKTEEIDDQGLGVVAAAAAAAVAVADSCFLQTTGNEMALFS